MNHLGYAALLGGLGASMNGTSGASMATKSTKRDVEKSTPANDAENRKEKRKYENSIHPDRKHRRQANPKTMGRILRGNRSRM